MRRVSFASKMFLRTLLLLSLMANVYLVLHFSVDNTRTVGSSPVRHSSFIVVDKRDDLENSLFHRPDDSEELCSVFSPWYNILKSDRVTSLSDWNFKTTVSCPQFSINNYPTTRHKVSLDCRGDKGRLLKTWANSTRDITVVNFGDDCLASVIENCCTGSQLVPNVIHYIWYTDVDLGYFSFLSLMSIHRFVKPCLILIHGPFFPKGLYWDYFISISPNIIHVKRERPTSIFGHNLAYREHSSDIMRIEALTKYGGIYLDFDEIVLRPIEPLRKYEYVQGHELPNTMGSQLVMAKRNATFLRHWYEGYRTDYRTTWAWNALWFPAKLSKEYPHLIHVEGFNFTRPNWKQAKQKIFLENYDWSTNYGMHLYARFFNGTANHQTIRNFNTTLGSVSRHILFGNKELCSS